MAIKPQFLEKYSLQYKKIIDAGMSQQIIDSNKRDLDDQYSYMFEKNGDTATIKLYGPMSEDGPDWIDLYLGYGGTAYKNLNRAAKEILSDKEITKLKIFGNTPGGNIDGLDEAMSNLKQVRDSGVEVTVINKGYIASAGVWYCSAANSILALNPTVTIGSIGVVIDTMDFSGYYEEMGIKEISITNTESPNKRPDLSTKKGQAIYRKELDSLYDVFLQRVVDGRSVEADSIKALKGEMIIAAEAVKIGLMDGIEGGSSSVSISTKQQTKKTTKKETIRMDEELKEALSAITGSISALGGRLDKIEGTQPEQQKTDALSDSDKKFALNIVTGGKYSATVIAEAGKVLAGDANIATLKAMTAAVDAVMEKKAGKEAADGTEETGETQPNGQMLPGAKKEDNGVVESKDEIAAELARIKGEA